MKGIAVAAVIAALASAASLAGALTGKPASCCACFEGEFAHTSQVKRVAVDALFCAAAPGGNASVLYDRCQVITNGTGGFECTDQWSNASCATELAQIGVVCPSAGVPAADPLNLAALAVVLSAAGIVLLRRRSRRDA